MGRSTKVSVIEMSRPTLPAVDDSSEVLGSLAVSRTPRLGIVLDEDLGAMALALGDHTDVEARVKELAGCELPQRQDRAVEDGRGRAAP